VAKKRPLYGVHNLRVLFRKFNRTFRNHWDLYYRPKSLLCYKPGWYLYDQRLQQESFIGKDSAAAYAVLEEDLWEYKMSIGRNER
jgi:hypothetical protein